MINCFCFYILNISNYHSLKYLIISLINGHEINFVLWFQNILILLTILFLIIIYIFKKNFLIILFLLTLIAYIFQYSRINYFFFINNFNENSRATFGRFAEAFPNAMTGFYLSSLDVVTKGENHRIKIPFFCVIILILITKFHYYEQLDSSYNFKYGGIRLNIGAICIFMIFSLLPFEKIKKKTLIIIISKITSNTGGIYFIHRLIGKGYFRILNSPNDRGNLFFAL